MKFLLLCSVVTVGMSFCNLAEAKTTPTAAQRQGCSDAAKQSGKVHHLDCSGSSCECKAGAANVVGGETFYPDKFKKMQAMPKNMNSL
jgi:hypothetical protein